MKFVFNVSDKGAELAKVRGMAVVLTQKTRQNIVTIDVIENSEIIVPHEIWNTLVHKPAPRLEAWETTYLKDGKFIDSVEIIAGESGNTLIPFRILRTTIPNGVQIAGFCLTTLVTVELTKSGSLQIKEWRLSTNHNTASIKTIRHAGNDAKKFGHAVQAARHKLEETVPSDKAFYADRSARHATLQNWSQRPPSWSQRQSLA